MDKTSHDVAIEIAAQNDERDFNEADTRHKIIDRVLHEVLSWPINQTLHESFIKPGYSDFRLQNEAGNDLLFIEAKKEGIYFDLPNTYTHPTSSCRN